jgi:hypothetical protein
LITYSLPFLLTILQSALRFLIAALTFIACLLCSRGNRLFIPENDPAPGKVIQTQFHPNPVTGKNADVIHPHLSGDRSQYLMTILQFHLEHGITQRFRDNTILLDQLLFSHTFWVRKDNKGEMSSQIFVSTFSAERDKMSIRTRAGAPD